MGKRLNQRLFGSEDGRYLTLLFVLVAGLFLPNLVLQRPALDLPEVSDQVYQWHPWAIFFRESYLSGHFPLWNPYDMAGMPYLAFAAPSGCLYPPGFLYLLPFPVAATLNIFMHLMLTAGLSYWLFKELGRKPATCFISALAWTMSGQVFNLTLNFPPALYTQSWIALIFLAGLKLSKRLTLKWTLALTAGLFLSFMGGDPEQLIYVLAFFLWWMIVRPGFSRKKMLTIFCLSFGIFLMMTGSQLLPLMELTHYSLRGQAAFAPAVKVSVLEPVSFFLSYFSGLFLPIGGKPDLIISAVSFSPLYYGFLILAAFGLAVVRKENVLARRLSWFIVFLFVYLVLSAIPAMNELLTAIPLVGKLFRFYSAMSALGVCFILVASQGLDDLMEGKPRASLNAAKYFLPAYGAVAIAGSFFIKPAMMARVILGVVLLLFPFWRHRFKPAAWLVLIALIDIYGMALSYFPRKPYAGLKLEPEFVSRFSGTELKGRYIFFSPYLVAETGLPYSAGMIVKAASIDSRMRAPLWRYFQLVSLAFPDIAKRQDGKITFYDELQFRNPGQLASGRLDYLDLLNLRWVISRFPVRLLTNSGRYKLLGSEPLWIYENQSPLHRASIFHQTIKAGSDDQALNLIRQKKFDFRKTLLLPESVSYLAGGSLEQEGETVELFRKSADQIEVSVQAASSGYLFLDETYFPGWLAELDGKPARIWRANYAFRAVYIDSGKHIVRFFYRPVSFRIGIWCSLASIINFIGVAVFAGMRKKGRGRG